MYLGIQTAKTRSAYSRPGEDPRKGWVPRLPTVAPAAICILDRKSSRACTTTDIHQQQRHRDKLADMDTVLRSLSVDFVLNELAINVCDDLVAHPSEHRQSLVVYAVVRPENAAGIALIRRLRGYEMARIEHFGCEALKFRLDLS